MFIIKIHLFYFCYRFCSHFALGSPALLSTTTHASKKGTANTPIFLALHYNIVCFLQVKQQTNDNKFEQEIRAEQERKKKDLLEAKERREAFKQKAATFQ